MLMLNPATVLFLAALLAPSILMRIADDRPERAGARAVLLCNLAATIGPFCRLWSDFPPGIDRAIGMLSTLSVIAWAWLAAGAGWLISEVLIFLAARWLAMRDRQTKERLDREIETLVEEWGEPASQI